MFVNYVRCLLLLITWQHSISVHYIWCLLITFNTIILSNKFDWILIVFNWHCLVVMHPKFDSFSIWSGGKCVISAKSIVVHFKAVHFEVSKISMDIILLKLMSKCKTFLVHTLRELFFAGTNFCVSQFWDFLRELNFADFSLERKLEPFCELFDLCFSHLINFAGT